MERGGGVDLCAGKGAGRVFFGAQPTTSTAAWCPGSLRKAALLPAAAIMLAWGNSKLKPEASTVLTSDGSLHTKS